MFLLSDANAPKKQAPRLESKLPKEACREATAHRQPTLWGTEKITSASIRT